MVRNPFGFRPAPKNDDRTLNQRLDARARAAQAKESAEIRKTARRSGAASRETANRTIERNERDLDLALDAVGVFEPATLRLLTDELDSAEPITQHSTHGRAATPDGGLPAWLRDRCVAPDAERVVLDWLTFRSIFIAHKEFAAKGKENPLPQLYQAFALTGARSISLDSVPAIGREACDRVLHVSFALRAAQRATVVRDIGSKSGYAAADRWHAFDRSNRFITADLADWIVDNRPDDDAIATAIVRGDFAWSGVKGDGHDFGISPHDIDAPAFVNELSRTRS
jgi:hypothetical protein